MDNNPNLPELDKECLFNGCYRMGMKHETVNVMLGLPKKCDTVFNLQNKEFKWTYLIDSVQIIFTISDNLVSLIEEDPEDVLCVY
jgi:hypothetical protein